MLLSSKVVENIIRDDVDYSEVELTSKNENILFVEGIKDKDMIEYLYFHYNKEMNFTIIPMNGVSNIPKFNHAMENQKYLNIKYLTDNDYSARRWLKANHVHVEDVLTNDLYTGVKTSIKELEEYITNTPHFKHRASKKKLIRRIFDWKNLSNNNIKRLFNVLSNSF